LVKYAVLTTDLVMKAIYTSASKIYNLKMYQFHEQNPSVRFYFICRSRISSEETAKPHSQASDGENLPTVYSTM
jgi:hypothetical protein